MARGLPFRWWTLEPEGTGTVLRITRIAESTTRVALRLEGRIEAQWATLLERECSSLLGYFGAVSVDLAGVVSVDRSGVDALARLHHAGVEIRGASDLLQSILEAEGVPVAPN